jgi:WD40 repeat protein
MDPLGAGGGVQAPGTGGSGAGGAAGGGAPDAGGGAAGSTTPLGLDPPAIGSSCSPITFESGILNPCGHAWAVAYSLDGQLLATSGSWNGTTNVNLWRATDGSPVRGIMAHNGTCYDLAFSPDGKMLASAGQAGSDSVPGSGMVNLWDVSTGAFVRSLPISVPGSSSSAYGSAVSFSHDGKLIATGGIGNIEIWRVADGVRTTTMTVTGTTYQVRFSADDSLLIAAGTQGAQARVFKVSTGKVVLSNLSTASDQASADFSPDGKLIATNGPDGTVKIWNATSGALMQTMSGHIAMMGRVAWIDDDRLLSNDWNGLVILWTRDESGSFVRSGNWLAGTALSGSASSINMAVSPDKSRFVVGGLVNGQGGFVFFSL